MGNFIYKCKLGTKAKIIEVYMFPDESEETTFKVKMLNGHTYNGEEVVFITEDDFHEEFKFFQLI